MSDAYLIQRITDMEKRLEDLRNQLNNHRHHRDPKWDLWLRGVDRIGRAGYTDHFRSGSIPSGFSWISDGTFNGEPVSLDYDHKGTFLEVKSDSSPHFLADSISTYNDKTFYARIRTGSTTELGIRIDNGTDNNYAELILDPGVGSYTIDFRHRTGGGAVTDTPGPTYPASEFVTVRLLWYSVTTAVYGAIVGEDGNVITCTGWNTGALAWTPSRVGLKVQVDGGDDAACDWFFSDFE